MYEMQWWCVCAGVTTKLTTVVFSAGYQGYKRHCRRGGAEDDSEAPALDENLEKKKDFALENGVFEYDDSSTTEEKKKDTISNTHLWGHPEFHQVFWNFTLVQTVLKNRRRDNSVLQNVQNFSI